jgi:hypothetical protein
VKQARAKAAAGKKWLTVQLESKRAATFVL